MEYYLSNSDIFPSIKIRKDYKIRLCKSSKSIRILKKNNLYKQEGNYLRKIYNANTYLNAVEIHSQLSNIKHIGFEVTDSCNLKCTYCIYGELYKNHDLRSNKMIEWEKAKKLMDYLVDALFSSSNTTQKNIIYVSFYGGEPLLNMDFIKKMVNYTQSLSSSKIHFSYMMTSNAILLKKYIDFLQKYDFKVMISLDGDRENDGHRLFPNGKTSFDIVYSNVKYVQKNYPDYFNKNISFNSVINDLNNIYEIYSFIYKEFGKIPQISGINRIGLNDELKSKFEKISKAKPMNDKEVFVKRIDPFRKSI